MKALAAVCAAFVLLAPAHSVAQKRELPPTAGELAAITDRGRRLAAYDFAAAHATDAVLALSPKAGTVTRYIGRIEGDRWVVAFGRLNERHDRFLVVYEATQTADPTHFNVQMHDPAHEVTGFLLAAARGIETVLATFRGENRPYNVAVLPAAADGLYVYVFPAQTKADVHVHGGDVRYLLSPDGMQIIEERQMHRAILEMGKAGNAVAGYHAAVVDNVPEDTDVYLVLTRKPPLPQYVGTQKFVYIVRQDGMIEYAGTREEFAKRKP